MEQNLVQAYCPICKKKIKLFGGTWFSIAKLVEGFLPKKTKEDNCPECVMDIAIKIRLADPFFVAR